jgi:hypothetical protein
MFSHPVVSQYPAVGTLDLAARKNIQLSEKFRKESGLPSLPSNTASRQFTSRSSLSMKAA